MLIAEIAQQLYAERPDQVLFHYTSLKGLLGIVESRCLFASDVGFLNDAAEMSHSADLLGREIDVHLALGVPGSEILKQLRAWLSDRMAGGHRLHVACFTQAGNLLSQWRGYCPTAKGVSLGFAPAALCDSAASQSFLIGKCVYDRHKQEALARELLGEIRALAMTRGESSKHHPSQSFYGVFEEVEDDLLRIAALLKSPSFSEEREWRAVSPVTKNYVKAPIEYREGASMLTPYVPFTLPTAADGSLALDIVILGPTPNSNQSMSSLGRFLSKRGVAPRQGLCYCQIPFRAW